MTTAWQEALSEPSTYDLGSGLIAKPETPERASLILSALSSLGEAAVAARANPKLNYHRPSWVKKNNFKADFGRKRTEAMQAFLGVYNADAPKEEQATLDDPLFQGAFGLFNSMFGTADSKRDLDTRLKHRLDVEKGLTDMLFRETVLVPVEPIQPRETPFFVGH